jgi:hypothetical protein
MGAGGTREKDKETAMLIKTRRSGMVWVEWPPVEDGECWCLGASSDGRYLTAYRAVDGRWEAVAWEELGSEQRERDDPDLLH